MADHVKETPRGPWLTLERRGRLYRILTALGAVGIWYGWIQEAELGVLLTLAATVLGTGVASANSPARKVAGDA